MQQNTLDLLPGEQAAMDFVSTIGVERAQRVLNLVCARIERRARLGGSFGQPLPLDYVRVAPWERTLIYNLKMGLQIINSEYLSPAAAKQRLLKRIAERNARLAQKKQKAA